MKIVYIGSFPPDFMVERSGGKIDSLYRAHNPLIRGFREHPDVTLNVITSPDVASWPRGPFFIRREYNRAEEVTLVSSLNISFLKQVWTIVTMAHEANKIIRQSKEPVVVMIPYMVFRHVCTLRLLKLLHPKVVFQACVIPDVFFPDGWLAKRVNHWTERVASKFDAFVLYTEKMAEHLHIRKGKYEVIEGFRELLDRKPNISGGFNVVYAGSLNMNYGVGRLVDAMKLIEDDDVQLHLYGAGTGEQYIKDASQKDNRIFYHGKVSNAVATDAIYSATVLINPRNAKDGTFTEYSFPSKDIEYMTTGIPTLLCRLPGMPKEYNGHFIDIGDAQPKEIANAIIKVKKMSEAERRELGKESREFIAERMDYRKQTNRIISLLQRNLI